MRSLLEVHEKCACRAGHVCLFIVYLTTLFQCLIQYSVDVGGKPAASAQFLLNADLSARAIY
jgi:hypothetical protein